MIVPTVAFATAAGAAPGGNSANAKACQKGGWQNLVRADQTPFANQGECVSYGAQGGPLTVPVVLPDLVADVSCSVLAANSYSCTLAVRNDGDAAASSGWRFNYSASEPLGGESSGSELYPNELAPGASAVLIAVGANGSSLYPLTIDLSLDTTNVLAERDETNNTFHQVFNP
jgi:hypothetical protein